MADVPDWLKDLSAERKAQLKNWLDKELQTVNRRDLLKAIGGVGVGSALGGAAVNQAVQPAKAARTGVAELGTPSNPATIWLDQLRDDADNLIADVDTGQYDWQGADFTNLGSVNTDKALINSNQVYVQGTAPSSPSTGDVWIDNDG